MNILVFATNWPPESTPRAIHNHRLLTGLADKHSVYLIIPSISEVQSNSNGLGLKIYQTYNFKKSIINKLLGRLGLAFNFPDPYIVGFLLSFFKISKIIKDFKPDIIFTISKFDSSHVMGLLIRKTNRLPWLMFMSDPWTDMELYGFLKYNMIQRVINKRLELSAFHKSDKIIVTNHSTIKILSDRLPIDKMIAIPQSFDSEIVLKAIEKSATRSEVENKIVMRYLGDFYGNRSPMPLLKALASMKRYSLSAYNKLSVEFYGKFSSNDTEDCKRVASELEIIKFNSPVSYLESLQLARESDILLTIDADVNFSPFLPSKLIDYLSVRKPIFSITPKGEAYDFTLASKGFVANPGNIEEIINMLFLIIKFQSEGKLKECIAPADFVDQFTSHNILRRYMVLFEEITTNKCAVLPE